MEIPITTMPQIPTSTPTLLTVTPLLSPTSIASQTAPATLAPERAKKILETQLQYSEDCDAPCFLMVMPGKTSFDEAKEMFNKLGLKLNLTLAEENKKFYAALYDFDDGLSITLILTVQDDLVENLRLYITPEEQNEGKPRGWLAYSPDTLINRYGIPSKIDLFFGGAAPNPSYIMDIYFETRDLIIEYSSYDLGPNLQICPLTDQMDSVRVWMGKNPVNPPLEAVPLKDATDLTVKEFSDLMLESSNGSCFIIKVD